MIRLPLSARIAPIELSEARKIIGYDRPHLRQCKYYYCRGAFPTCAVRLRPPLSPRPSGRNSGTRADWPAGLAVGDATRSQRHAAQPSGAVGAFATARAATGIPRLDIWYTTDQSGRQRSIRARSSGARGSGEDAKPDARLMAVALGGPGRDALRCRNVDSRRTLRPRTARGALDRRSGRRQSSRRRRPARAVAA
jgi:hypothetical protein